MTQTQCFPVSLKKRITQSGEAGELVLVYLVCIFFVGQGAGGTGELTGQLVLVSRYSWRGASQFRWKKRITRASEAGELVLVYIVCFVRGDRL